MTTTAGVSKDKLDEHYMGLMSSIEKMNSQMRALIIPKTPLDTGAFLDEWVSGDSSPLSMTLNLDRPALITNILYAFIPYGSATLNIGPASGTTRSIPLQTGAATAVQFLQVAMVVNPGDVISLVSLGATSLFVEIMGKVFSGTDWSHV